VFSSEDQVISAPPDTANSPALADAIPARDPHNADTPYLVNLFIVNSFCFTIHMNFVKLPL
jgi:hypothetical protein